MRTLRFALAASVAAGPATGQDFDFVDRTEAAGIRFHHEDGGSGRRYVIEIVGAGVAVFDYDGDGWPDLFFVNGHPLPGDPGGATVGNRLFRNRGDGTFEDRTEAAGLLDAAEARHYGMGALAGDLDGDGDPDLLVTHFGDERLFWNRGDGTFREAPGAGGATDSRWTTSAALFDADGDGDLDVYAANYLDYAIDRHRDCVSPVRELLAYCHPQEYPGAVDSFFENLGDGTFRASPVPGSENGKGLGVVVTDLGGDGAPDVHVANDTTPNFLFRTVSGPEGVAFLEEGLASGVAYNEEGLPEAGMGNDFGDVDRDGLMDLVVTNFDFETNTLYRNLGGGLFLDSTAAFGMGSESLTELAFGCDLADFDNDGWLDLVVANGHILDNIARIQTNLSFAQPGQVFRNDQGRLRRSRESEGAFARPRVGRGLATLDYDLDGDLDLVLANNRGAAELLENRGGAEAGNAAGFLLIGTAGNREGIGARVRVDGAGLTQEEERRAGGSYLSQHDPVMWFGLGAAPGASEVRVRWPSGKEESLGTLPEGAVHILKEGAGHVASLRIGPGTGPRGAAR
jgi:hypothetical protein